MWICDSHEFDEAVETKHNDSGMRIMILSKTA